MTVRNLYKLINSEVNIIVGTELIIYQGLLYDAIKTTNINPDIPTELLDREVLLIEPIYNVDDYSSEIKLLINVYVE